MNISGAETENSVPTPPAWLPDLIPLTGEKDEITQRLYAVFQRDFDETGLYFRHCPVRYNNQMQQGYPEKFWHVIERERKDADWREFEPQRAERLAWCAAVIRNAKDPCVSVWSYMEGNGEQHIYLWLEACDYLVVLNYRPKKKGRGGVFWLVTAFVVDSDFKRHDLKTKRANRHPPNY